MEAARVIEETMQPAGIKTQAWQHQCRAVEFAEHKSGALFAHAMGSGKSLSTIALLNTWKATRVIIVCPVSVLGVWPREFETHSSEKWIVKALTFGTAADKGRELERLLKLADAKNENLAIVVNYESIWRPRLAQMFELYARRKVWDVLVCDEVHRAKAPGGKSSRWLATFAKHIPKKLGLTGTPMPHSILDIYGQFRILDPSVFGYRYTSFRSQYANMGGYGNYKPVSFKNQKMLADKMSTITHQVTKDEALPDLPPELFLRRECVLNPKTFKIYKDLERKMIALIDEEVFTVKNGLVKLLRLQQITSGFLELEATGLQIISTAKIDLMRDLAQDIEPPFVVFCRFRHDLKQVEQMADDMGLRYGEVSGARKDLDQGEMPEWVQILGVQIQAGGIGIDLTRACTALWFSVGFSLGDYQQACARLHRPGQESTVRHIHLIAADTIDDIVFGALKKKQQLVEEVIKRLRG